MNILFTCGGTAGHINPAVALARMFREREGAERCRQAVGKALTQKVL